MTILQVGLDYLPYDVSLLAGKAFNFLPDFAGVTPALMGGAFFLVTRTCDTIANRIVLKQWIPSEHILKNESALLFLKRQAISGAITILTGAVSAAIFALATDTVFLPFVVSVATLAAIVWITTKATGVVIYAVEAIISAIKHFFSHKNNDYSNDSLEDTEDPSNVSFEDTEDPSNVSLEETEDPSNVFIEESTNCSICTEEVVLKEGKITNITKNFMALESDLRGIKTQCNHIFHAKCLADWVECRKKEKQSPNCPNCRTEFKEEINTISYSNLSTQNTYQYQLNLGDFYSDTDDSEDNSSEEFL